MSKVVAVRPFNRPNNRLYANSNGYAIRNNKGDQVSSISAIWAIYHHMIMGPIEESVESQHSYCPNDDKTWLIYMIDQIVSWRASCQSGGLTQNQNESINNMIWSKMPEKSLCSKIILFANEMKWNEGAHGRKSFLKSLNVKCGPNVIAGTWKENSLQLSIARSKITEKYKKRRQVLRQLRKQDKKGNSYIPGGFSTKIITMLILQAMDQSPKYKHKICANNHLCFQCWWSFYNTLSQ